MGSHRAGGRRRSEIYPDGEQAERERLHDHVFSRAGARVAEQHNASGGTAAVPAADHSVSADRNTVQGEASRVASEHDTVAEE